MPGLRKYINNDRKHPRTRSTCRISLSRISLTACFNPGFKQHVAIVRDKFGCNPMIAHSII
jgi:hypothetical protein